MSGKGKIDPNALEMLTTYAERIEALDRQTLDIACDSYGVIMEAEENGFDEELLQQLLRLREMDRRQLSEQQSMLNLFINALDTSDELPL